MKRMLWIAMAGALTFAMSGTAHADCNEEQEQAKSGEKKNYKTIIGPDGRKTFVIKKAFVVCGKVPKPTVVYAFQASTINYEWETLKRDFLPQVLKSLSKDPF